MEVIHYDDLEICVERFPRRKQMSIYLAPKKPIIIRVSMLTPKSYIIDFIKSKINWIQKNKKRFEKIESQFPSKKIKETEIFPFKGKDYSLKVVITPGVKNFISVTENQILLHIPINEWSANSKIQEHAHHLQILREFYKREGVQFISERVQHWAQQMHLFPVQVKFREQKSRWGSCTSTKIINLNWRLILFEEKIVDYVVVHELAHLKHMDHSKNFWNLVQQFCPEHKLIKAELRKKQLLTQFLDLNSKY